MKNAAQATALTLLALTHSQVALAQQPNPFGEIEPVPRRGEPPSGAPTEPAQPPDPLDAPTAAPASPPPYQANVYQSASPPAVDNRQASGAWGGPEAPPGRAGLVFIPRLGFLLSGRATLRSNIKCPDAFLFSLPTLSDSSTAAGFFCNPLILGTAEDDGHATDQSSVLVQADLLYHVAPAVRIGGSALWNLTTEVSKPEVLTPVRLGTDLSLNLTVEHLYADNGNSALLYRVMAGPSVLLAGDDLKVAERQAKGFCREMLKVCEFDSDFNLGYNFGAGLGALIPAGGSALRADLLLNYVTVPFRSVVATAQDPVSSRTVDAEVTEEASFVRLWFSVGTEF